MKNFFKKIKNYIANSAWLSPLLIVVVIFLLLFLLNPISNGIRSLVSKIQAHSTMETISYKEYVELVNKQYDSSKEEKYIVVFTANDCENCDLMYPDMNDYIKFNKRNKITTDFKIVNVDLSTKKIKNANGEKQAHYKDRTIDCFVTGLADDYLTTLDNRIAEWVKITEDYNSGSLTTISDDKHYEYLATPLMIWYINGVEVKVSNGYTESNGNDFDSYIAFPDKALESEEIQSWIANKDKDSIVLTSK